MTSSMAKSGSSRITHMWFNGFCLVSTVLLVATVFLMPLSWVANPRLHHVSLTDTLHVGLCCRGLGDLDPGGCLVFFNDSLRGPYQGGLIAIRIGGAVYGGPDHEVTADWYGVAHRYFRWPDYVVWTLMVRLFYPVLLFSVLPAMWLIPRLVKGHRNRLLSLKRPGVMQPECNISAAAYNIGWWLESAGHKVVGPAARTTVLKYLHEGMISRGTLVRHCIRETARPVAEMRGILEGIDIDEGSAVTQDRLEEAWPEDPSERLKLAETDLECAWHRRAAILVCTRCHAPYCDDCRMTLFRRSYYMCRRCQCSNTGRRLLALIVDCFLVAYGVILPFSMAAFPAGARPPTVSYFLIVYGAIVVCVLRDAVCQGAGPGKRLMGLRVVMARDGVTPLGYGQAFVRSLPFVIPLLPIVEAIVMSGDSQVRRFGDRWAGTLVIDTPARLAKVRERIVTRLAKKGIPPCVGPPGIQ